MIVGLISDTHGLLRPEASIALQRTDLIIHAGDVGKLEVLERLRAVAPVFAVRGNTDKGEWASRLPAAAVVEAGEASIYVLHDIGELSLRPAPAQCRVVVSGHSHKPASEERDGVLYVNPGSAGPRRFHLPTTVARLDLRKAPYSVEFIKLAEM